VPHLSSKTADKSAALRAVGRRSACPTGLATEVQLPSSMDMTRRECVCVLGGVAAIPMIEEVATPAEARSLAHAIPLELQINGTA
jgi:hypothetical protein